MIQRQLCYAAAYRRILAVANKKNIVSITPFTPILPQFCIKAILAAGKKTADSRERPISVNAPILVKNGRSVTRIKIVYSLHKRSCLSTSIQDTFSPSFPGQF